MIRHCSGCERIMDVKMSKVIISSTYFRRIKYNCSKCNILMLAFVPEGIVER